MSQLDKASLIQPLIDHMVTHEKDVHVWRKELVQAGAFSTEQVLALDDASLTLCYRTMLAVQFQGLRAERLLSEIEKTCTHVGIIRNGKMLFQDTVVALKQSKGKKIMIDLEVDKFIDAMTVLESLNKENTSLTDEFIQIEVDDKNEITTVIDALRAKDIAVYQVSIKNNLEELFLSLTEN